MICIKCGLVKRGEQDYFVCEDCESFSVILRSIFEEVHSVFEKGETIDPETDKILALLADSSFITAKNPKTAIFYKLSEFVVARAFDGKSEITEEELNREVPTTRAWGDVLKTFEELGLLEVRLETYRRVLVLTDKTKKMALQFLNGEPFSKQVQLRLSHVYAGYVLLHILNKIAEANEVSDLDSLPYNQRPKTLWVVVMFLWSTAYGQEESFSEEKMRIFFSKRRIPSNTRGRIVRALQAMDGRTVQGLVKDVAFEDGERMFSFEDYVLVEMERLRERIRERAR